MEKISGKQVKLLAGFEANGLAWSNGDLGAGSRISTDAGLAWFDGEDSEAAQLDAVPCHKRLLHALEDGVYGRFGLGTGQPGALHNPLNEILLNHLSRCP